MRSCLTVAVKWNREVLRPIYFVRIPTSKEEQYKMCFAHFPETQTSWSPGGSTESGSPDHGLFFTGCRCSATASRARALQVGPQH